MCQTDFFLMVVMSFSLSQKQIHFHTRHFLQAVQAVDMQAMKFYLMNKVMLRHFHTPRFSLYPLLR